MIRFLPFFAFSVIFISCFSTYAFVPLIFKGEVELKNGETREGGICLDYEKELVRFYDQDGTVHTYSPFNVSSIYFYDKLLNQPRTFVSLQHSPKGNRIGGYYFYELLKVGQMDILRKVGHNLNLDKLSDLAYGKRVKEHDKQFTYYIFFNGSLIPLKKFASSIFPILKRRMGNELEEFISERKIDINAKLQPLIVIEFFNATSKNNTIKAGLN